VVTMQRVLNLVNSFMEMFVRAGEFIRNHMGEIQWISSVRSVGRMLLRYILLLYIV